MKWFQIFAGALLLIVLAGFYIQSKTGQVHDTVYGLCATTRTGEPFGHVQERAKERELTFTKVSAPGRVPEEHRAALEGWGERYGCTVRVKDGRVVDTTFGALPREDG